MLQNLENLVGCDAIIRIQMINEKRNKLLSSIGFKNFVYFITNPFKIFLILIVISFKLPESITTVVMLFEWMSRLLEFFYFRNIKGILSGEKLVSKRIRIESCTDYGLLINIFERPVLENINKINYYLFIFIIVISGRPFQAAVLTLLCQSISGIRKVLKELLIDYLKDLIKEDWKIGTT